MTNIKFGTDGWRALIADEFTFDNVGKIAQAYCDYLHQNQLEDKGIAIGYDTRFLSDKFAETFAKITYKNQVRVILSDSFVPTPVLSFAVKHMKLAGGIMLTASHNPYYYNGIKFKDSYGGPVLQEVTQSIQENISKSKIKSTDQNGSSKKYLLTDYNNHIFELINFGLIKEFKGKIIINPMYGSGIGILENLLSNTEINCKSINNKIKYDFGGVRPEPIMSNLTDLKEAVLNNDALIGVATDGDADRFGVLDENGNFVNLHILMPLLTKYLIESRDWTGNIVKTISMTDLIDKIAERFNRKVFEVPVGFKNVTEIMLQEDILIGGEESGGFGYKNHIPERDGIFSILLILEMLAYYDQPITVLADDLHKRYGTYYYDRIDKYFDLKILQKNLVKLSANPPEKLNSMKVEKVNLVDGIKLHFAQNSWILIRISQTEPLARVYVCSENKQLVNSLLQSGIDLITELKY